MKEFRFWASIKSITIFPNGLRKKEYHIQINKRNGLKITWIAPKPTNQ
jgi:hypothetical protein